MPCSLPPPLTPNLPLSLLVSVTPSHDLQLDGKAKLHCKANPVGVGVQWQGPDKKIHPAAAEVSLDPVGRQNAGTWKCTLSLSSDTHTESLVVTVKGDL